MPRPLHQLELPHEELLDELLDDELPQDELLEDDELLLDEPQDELLELLPHDDRLELGALPQDERWLPVSTGIGRMVLPLERRLPPLNPPPL